MQFKEIDWEKWQHDDHATLLFVIRDNEILLIRKKRGLGKGKITGPGGRLEAGETPRKAAMRETEEELRIQVETPRHGGRLLFQFKDGYALRVEVFSARGFEGEPTETEEAKPLWFHLEAIPYGEMWADDILWMPLLIAGLPFEGRFLFDGDAMSEFHIQSPADLT